MYMPKKSHTYGMVNSTALEMESVTAKIVILLIVTDMSVLLISKTAVVPLLKEVEVPSDLLGKKTNKSSSGAMKAARDTIVKNEPPKGIRFFVRDQVNHWATIGEFMVPMEV